VVLFPYVLAVDDFPKDTALQFGGERSAKSPFQRNHPMTFADFGCMNWLAGVFLFTLEHEHLKAPSGELKVVLRRLFSHLCKSVTCQ